MDTDRLVPGAAVADGIRNLLRDLGMEPDAGKAGGE